MHSGPHHVHHTSVRLCMAQYNRILAQFATVFSLDEYGSVSARSLHSEPLLTHRWSVSRHNKIITAMIVRARIIRTSRVPVLSRLATNFQLVVSFGRLCKLQLDITLHRVPLAYLTDIQAVGGVCLTMVL
jgi:hypothetical protein